jgi:hypothetical protein
MLSPVDSGVDRTALIIGIVVAIVVLIIIAVVIGATMIIKKKKYSDYRYL